VLDLLRSLTLWTARLGVHPGLSRELEPRIVLTNVVSAIVWVVCVPYVPMHLATGSPIRAALLLGEMTLLLGVFVANHRRRYLLARWLMLLTLDLSVGTVAATAGPGSLVWVSLIAVAAMSSLPFTRHERPHAWAGMGLAVAIGIVGYSDVTAPLGGWLGEEPFPPFGEIGIVVGSIIIAPLLVYWQATAKDAHVTALDRSRERLEAEVERGAELARALQLRSEQAREASQAKSRFLAHMSHEIRTPLAAVISLVELSRDADEASRDTYLDTASESAAHLLRILNDILDLSKVEQGSLEVEVIPFDLAELVDDVVRLTRVRASVPGPTVRAEVSWADDAWRQGDPLRLKQVLLNLASNAVKFTKSGWVTVRVEARGDRVRFEVSDTGSGMDPQQLSRVFDAFHQADPSITRTHGGTGLGLTISKHIVERMGGSLRAESKPGQGSRFWFELPLPVTAEPSVVSEPSFAPDDAAGLRVLVAEDNAVNRLIATKVLEQLGHRVEVVEDGFGAVERALDGFDVVLMDVQMPGMDGLEAARRIRAIEAERGYARLPIVALTANAMKGDRELCLDAGMDEHLPKPIDRELATQILTRIARNRLRAGA
jgi:signal transduction histidine kinase